MCNHGSCVQQYMSSAFVLSSPVRLMLRFDSCSNPFFPFFYALCLTNGLNLNLGTPLQLYDLRVAFIGCSCSVACA